MGWDPKVAITIYHQPIDFYAKTAEAVAKQLDSEKLALEELEKEFSLYKPKEQSLWLPEKLSSIELGVFGEIKREFSYYLSKEESHLFARKITVLESGTFGSESSMNKYVTDSKVRKIEEIKSKVDSIAKNLSCFAKGFEGKLVLEIDSINFTIKSLNNTYVTYLKQYREILNTQSKF